MVTLLERRRAVEFDNIPSVRNSRFSRHFLATRETIFAGDDRQPLKVVNLPKIDNVQWPYLTYIITFFHLLYIFHTFRDEL